MLFLNHSVTLVKQLGLSELQFYSSIKFFKGEVKIQEIYVHKILCKCKFLTVVVIIICSRPLSWSKYYSGP